MFTILKDWKIYHSKSKKYSRQCCINPNDKNATIYPWNGKNEPDDYLLHEYLHIALRALRRIDKRKIKEYLDSEEILIREICKKLKGKKYG